MYSRSLLSLSPPPVPQKRFATLSDETLKDKDSEITKKKKATERDVLKYVMKRVNLTRKVPLLTPGTALIDY